MPEEITVVGQTNFRRQKRPFGIYTDDRRRHVYLIGKTGVGKTTLLENMIIQDIKMGRGLALVDPHGDVAEKILDLIPPGRINDVVYFDPADVDFPVAFNPLESVDPQYKYLVASGLVSSLKKIWADSWGPRLEYILRNVILALLDYPNSTMLGIMRMLSDKGYRKKVVDTISDPVVKAFWVNEFANYNERFRSEAISPIQNKVGQFLSSSIIRNIVAQPKSTIDMKDIMDNGKILLINVSKGRIGEDNSALLGAMLITKLQLAAMDRARIPENERKDFYLYVDEFQNFATESFATILSEARKYRLNLIIAHQYITQMEEVVRDAVFGNVGTIISFRVGAFDAEYLEKEFMPYFTQTDLVNLDKYNAYIKLMINGATSAPFSMETIPPVAETYNSREKVLAVSRERYGNARKDIEDNIARWSGAIFEEGDEQQSRPPMQNKGQQNRPINQNTPGNFQQRPQQQRQSDELEDVIIAPAKQEMITDLSALLGGNKDSSFSPPRMRGSQPASGQVGGGQFDESLTTPSRSPLSKGEKSKPAPILYDTICSSCKKNTQVPFKPDPEKEVFCKECFDKRKKLKSEQLSPFRTTGSTKQVDVPLPKKSHIEPSKVDPISNYHPPKPPKL